MEMPDSTYSEELNRAQQSGDARCSGAAVDVDRYLEKEVLMLRTKIQNLAKKYRAARDVLRDFRAEMRKHQNSKFGEFRCPHCGSTKGTWFDRSFVLDPQGNEVPEESFPDRCLDCGKNVDAPPCYYSPNAKLSEPEEAK